MKYPRLKLENAAGTILQNSLQKDHMAGENRKRRQGKKSKEQGTVLERPRTRFLFCTGKQSTSDTDVTHYSCVTSEDDRTKGLVASSSSDYLRKDS
ncbi:hypothetical protein OS493_024181 [Desmophyllum pertusum]|uniref:Uncharacterized protein n=1 Tax=Desmophyllum pertusum TaxID=174260 RepID=A0A9W9ZAY8_9CNID|nr:hypothetical protein OS493_024181 [Desmophyllum pertusum]